jgi:hypothetical protein
MATIQIADNDARVQYTQAVVANTTQLTIDFPFFDLDDINIIVTSEAGVDTTLSRGTGTGTFAVTGTSVDDGFSGGHVTLGDSYASASTKYTIFRDIPVSRTTDFPTSGPFNISSLNTELDKIFAVEQELETKITRTMRLADSDTAADLALPNLDTRKGTVLAFNSTTGLPEAGPEIADISTIQAITADISTLADIEDGTDATDAIQTVAGIAANVSTVAGVSANVTTVAGQTTNMQNITDNLSDVQNAATNATNAAASASAASTSETNAATSESNSASSATSSANSATASASSATASAASASAASTSESNAATSESNASTSETNAASSASSASTSASTATTQAGIATTKAGEAATSATNAATSETNAATSASAASASQVAAAASAASAASAFDNFDDTYLGSYATDPTVDNDGDALTQGDLYFNSTANEMRVYDGGSWIAASSAGGVSLLMYEYTATAAQTTFSGADDNANTLSYTIDNIIVTLNGITLDPSDYTATSGTSIVLASGAALNDELNIIAFKSFTTADMVSATNGGTFGGNVTVNGTLAATAVTGDGSGLTGLSSDLVDDTTPQLGGDLDLNSSDITGTGNVTITGAVTADGLTVDTNTLYVDSTNNRVGIGDSTPLDKVHIYESVNSATATQLLLQNEGAGSNAAGIAFQVSSSGETTGFAPKAGIVFERQLANGGGSLKFFNDGVSDTNGFSATDEVMRIDSSGTVTATAFVGDGSGLTGLSSGAVGLTDVGSFIMGRTTDTATRAAGTTLSASLVRYSNVLAQASGTPSGTLRVHGYTNGGNTSTRTSVFQRIS